MYVFVIDLHNLNCLQYKILQQFIIQNVDIDKKIAPNEKLMQLYFLMIFNQRFDYLLQYLYFYRQKTKKSGGSVLI